jgi:hypothetical protein
LLDTLIKGDGTNNGTTSHTYASISYQLASDVAEIAQLCGYRATHSKETRGYHKYIHNQNKPSYCHDIYLIYISKKQYQYVKSSQITYNDMVYCLGVDKYHTLYVRRNGRASWSGNSYWNQNSFWYYTNRNSAYFIRNNTIRFQEYRNQTIFYNDFWREHNIPVVIAWLRAIKSDKKRPHAINI